MGHEVVAVPTVAGGMNAIQFGDDGLLTGMPAGAPTARRSVLPADWRARASGLGWRERWSTRHEGSAMMTTGINLKRACSILLFCTMSVSQEALASQQTPEELARSWVEAIKENSTAKMRALIHPACPQSAITPEMLARMVQGGLPEKYEIETR
jgi:hypothetical protein